MVMKLNSFFLLLYLLFMVHETIQQNVFTVNILFVNEFKNLVANKAADVVLNYLRRNPRIGIHVNGFYKLDLSGNDAQTILESLCIQYNNSIKDGKPPHVILDTTQAGIVSEAVKTFTAALALPTISASYGQDGDIKQWRNLDGEQQKFLIQINPPADIIPEIVRSIIIAQNITDAGILFDDSFVMDHKYKSLLQNIPTRHIIAQIEDSRSIQRQLTRFRDLDIVNYFVLGKLSNVKTLLDNANVNKFFGRKFAWHVITQDKGTLRCSCSNASVLFVKPEPDSTSRERLSNLRTTYGLTSEPEIMAAFYFDFIFRGLLAIKSMAETGEWSKNFTYTTCNEYKEENQPIRKNFDLRKHLKQVLTVL